MIRFSIVFSIVFLVIITGCGEINSDTQKKVLVSALPLIDSPDAREIPIKNTIIWHWENRFEKQEVHKIKQWLSVIDVAIIDTYGKYPFDMHFYIHRSKSGNEPVPWAHTTRGKDQGVHFHVNTTYSITEFLTDWTAQHEISHLSIPFVGKENTWFSEGYATYMQCQVMQVQGVLTSDDVKYKYATKLANCKQAYQSDLTVPQAADSLKKAWNYPALYWGGASFFWKLNAQYSSEIQKTLPRVIAEYVKCCRIGHRSPEEICETLDQITETKIASKLLNDYKTEPARLMFEEF